MELTELLKRAESLKSKAEDFIESQGLLDKAKLLKDKIQDLKKKDEDYYTPLRQNMYLQYTICRITAPVMATASLDGKKLLSLEKKQGSVSSYLISAMSRTMVNHPKLNASFVRHPLAFLKPEHKRSKILQFDTVDAAVSIDKEFKGERYPLPYIFKKTDQWPVKEIHDKLQYLAKAPVSEVEEWMSYFKFLKLPYALRKIFIGQMVSNKEALQSKIGSFNFTNLGKWEGLEYAYAHSPRLVIAVGRARPDFTIPVSYSFNHVICDGAQIGEFHEDLNKMIQKMDFD